MKKVFSIVFMFLLTGCSSINSYLGFKDDNVIEETIEMLIESQTGIDVDLTP